MVNFIVNQFREPSWKSWIAFTNEPIFTPEQCDDIIKVGRSQPRENAGIGGASSIKGRNIDIQTRLSHISWIPFDFIPLYEKLHIEIQAVNRNHFGFDNVCLSEQAQYTEYSDGGFYDWHMDSDHSGVHQPLIRKISMTCCLTDPEEYEGGELLLMDKKTKIKLKKGYACFFASFLKHKVMPVTKGNRKSLVVWFGGPSFK
jgi:PKHD-type hydroxylase